MDLQGRDLQRGLRGEDVQLLHSELARIGLMVASLAEPHAYFGPSIRDAVKRFHMGRGLETTRIVDTRTAAAISKAAPERSAGQGGSCT